VLPYNAPKIDAYDQAFVATAAPTIRTANFNVHGVYYCLTTQANTTVGLRFPCVVFVSVCVCMRVCVCVCVCACAPIA
jgi:hypothetical protein